MSDEKADFDLVKKTPLLDPSPRFRQEVMRSVRDSKLSSQNSIFDFFKFEEWIMSSALCGISCFFIVNFHNENLSNIDNGFFTESLEEILLDEELPEYYLDELSFDSDV